MVSCSEIQLLLGPFDDGELEPHEMQDVALHIVTCRDCNAALEDYRALGVALRNTVRPPAVDLTPAVLARLEAMPRPWRHRVRAFIESFGRIGTAIEVVSLAAVTAVLTVVIANPAVQKLVKGPTHDSPPLLTSSLPRPVAPIAFARTSSPARRMTPAVASSTPVNQFAATEPPEVQSASAMQDLAAELGAGDSQSVAVWNEPNTHTTVVWVPDQP
ncbi:MAG TPA: zf-HC2 domain-containing protein [Candidatus Binataceae bacterium]|jgi:anti-sigma factor RsiW|nr:zf-HC2 domain-containing protein [Candidatus Binataceae bacterium]